MIIFISSMLSVGVICCCELLLAVTGEVVAWMFSVYDTPLVKRSLVLIIDEFTRMFFTTNSVKFLVWFYYCDLWLFSVFFCVISTVMMCVSSVVAYTHVRRKQVLWYLRICVYLLWGSPRTCTLLTSIAASTLILYGLPGVATLANVTLAV